MSDGPIRVVAFGDAAVLVVLGDRIDVALSERIHRLTVAIREAFAGEAGWQTPVPAYASVLVPVDPIEPGVEAAMGRIRALTAELDRLPVTTPDDVGPRLEIPVRYGGVDGPDLDNVATAHGLQPADVVELHASIDYRIFFLGFAPGFAYLGPVPAAIATPRLASPRTHVPAGSVGIAGTQTGVYPFDSPGGWRIIGRTEARLWNARRDPPALLAPGGSVRFVPVR